MEEKLRTSRPPATNLPPARQDVEPPLEAPGPQALQQRRYPGFFLHGLTYCHLKRHIIAKAAEEWNTQSQRSLLHWHIHRSLPPAPDILLFEVAPHHPSHGPARASDLRASPRLRAARPRCRRRPSAMGRGVVAQHGLRRDRPAGKLRPADGPQREMVGPVGHGVLRHSGGGRRQGADRHQQRQSPRPAPPGRPRRARSA